MRKALHSEETALETRPWLEGGEHAAAITPSQRSDWPAHLNLVACGGGKLRGKTGDMRWIMPLKVPPTLWKTRER